MLAGSIRLPPGHVGQQQGVVAHLVDQPGHAAGGLKHALARLLREDLFAASARRVDLRLNVVLGLGAVEGFEVAAGGQALAERVELGAGETFLQHGPAGQHQPHQRLAAASEIGQQADFFQQAKRQRMGLVDQQHQAVRAVVAGHQVVDHGQSQSRLRPCRDRAGPIRTGSPETGRGGCSAARWRAWPPGTTAGTAPPGAGTAASCRCPRGRSPAPPPRRVGCSEPEWSARPRWRWRGSSDRSGGPTAKGRRFRPKQPSYIAHASYVTVDARRVLGCRTESILFHSINSATGG